MVYPPWGFLFLPLCKTEKTLRWRDGTCTTENKLQKNVRKCLCKMLKNAILTLLLLGAIFFDQRKHQSGDLSNNCFNKLTQSHPVVAAKQRIICKINPTITSMLICHFKAAGSKYLHCLNGTCLIGSWGKKYFVTNCHNGIITSKMMELLGMVSSFSPQQSVLKLWYPGSQSPFITGITFLKHNNAFVTGTSPNFMCAICIQALFKGVIICHRSSLFCCEPPFVPAKKRVENCACPVDSSPARQMMMKYVSNFHIEVIHYPDCTWDRTVFPHTSWGPANLDEIISNISTSANQIETWLRWPSRESNEISQRVACQKAVALETYLRRLVSWVFADESRVFMEKMSISLSLLPYNWIENSGVDDW